MLHWIYSAIIGLITGAIASLLLPGSEGLGLFRTMLVGLAGAFLGTALGRATGKIQQDAKAGWFWSILGSVIVLILLRVLF